MNPKGDDVRGWAPGLAAGDAVGGTWAERRVGAWLQTSDSSFRCRKGLALAGLDVTPLGYGDRVIM